MTIFERFIGGAYILAYVFAEAIGNARKAFARWFGRDPES